MKKTNLLKQFASVSAIGAGLITSLAMPSQVKADSGYAMTQEQTTKQRFQENSNFKSDYCLMLETIYNVFAC